MPRPCELTGTLDGPAMASVRERLSRTIGRHPEQLVIEFNLDALANDLRFNEEAVLLEVLFFLAGVTDLHRSSDLNARLENEPTLLASLSDNGLLRGFSRVYTTARQIACDRCANNSELTDIIPDQSVGARPSSIDGTLNPGSENGKIGQAGGYFFTSTGFSSLKLRAYSAGITISLLPVNAVPAVPAPAPAKAPIAAPLPPPARPPMSAPKPAPPPISVAERLPLPFSLRAYDAVSTGTVWPLMLTDVSLSRSIAPPLKRPRGCASTTVPLALEPSGIATAPPTSTGRATVAVKVSPA